MRYALRAGIERGCTAGISILTMPFPRWAWVILCLVPWS